MTRFVNIGDLRKSAILQAVHQLGVCMGEDLYLVGGALRDSFTGKSAGKEFDFVMKGGVENIANAFAREQKGAAFLLNDFFQTWRVVIGEGAERIELDFSPLQGKDIFEDLKRRDFTVNSMAVSLRELFSSECWPVLDPLKGLEDLNQEILRANSEESFLQDPLRMLRAFRISSIMGLKIEPRTYQWIQSQKGLIFHSAGERIRQEIFKALERSGAGSFFKNLYRSGLLDKIFPDIGGWNEEIKDGCSCSDLMEHAVGVVEAGEWILEHLFLFFPTYADNLESHFSKPIEQGINHRSLLKFFCFFHDSGQAISKGGRENANETNRRKLEGNSPKINEMIAKRLKLSEKTVRIISELSDHFEYFPLLVVKGGIQPVLKYKFFNELGDRGIDLIVFGLAHELPGGKEKQFWSVQGVPVDFEKEKEIGDQLLHFYYEEYLERSIVPLINGRDIMEVLGLPPGKEIGEFLSSLEEAQMEGKIRTREEALNYLKKLDRFNRFR